MAAVSKSAAELVEELATCVTCGNVHQVRETGAYSQSWAAPDGHSYRTRLLEIAGWSSADFLEKLRKMAAS